MSQVQGTVISAIVNANKPSPTSHSKVSVVLKGLARLRGGATRQVKALREHHIAAMLRICPGTLIGKGGMRPSSPLALPLRCDDLNCATLELLTLNGCKAVCQTMAIQESSFISASRRLINLAQANGLLYRKGKKLGRLLACAVGYKNPEYRRDICFRRCEETVLGLDRHYTIATSLAW